MQASSRAVVLLAVLAGAAPAAAAGGANPLSKTIELLDALKAKIIKDGEEEAKAYKDYFEWCDDASKEKGFEIKTLTALKAKLEAAVEEASACIEATSTEVEELAASVGEVAGDLKNATTIREKEHAEFLAAETELAETVDTLTRALAILEKEYAKNPALVQVDISNFQALLQSVSTVIDAAGIASQDKQHLLNLMQSGNSNSASSEASSDAALSDEEAASEAALSDSTGAPDPTAYKSHSKSIIEVLEDMKAKAESELADLQKAEGEAAHNYDMIKQSLDDQKAQDEKNLGDLKSKLAGCEEDKAVAEGDLAGTVKDLALAKKALADLQASCMQVAADHEVTIAGRAAELKALGEATGILANTTGAAESFSYSLLQVSSGSKSKMKTRADLAQEEVVRVLARVAKQQRSKTMAQLVSKIQAVMMFDQTSSTADVFAKVKGLIKSLIDRLMAEAAAEAQEKAYCDEQMAKTEAKKSELEDDVSALTAKIEKAVAASEELKMQVKGLQDELSALAKLQAEMDKIRAEEHEAYVEAKADLELGLEGIRKALEILRDYYGSSADAEALLQDQTATGQPAKPELHEKSTGAGGGIIDILEVVESDFAKNLAEVEQEEADELAKYEKVTQENKVIKATDEQDVKYKTAEFKALDKAVAEMSSEKDTASAELAAVLEYYEKVKERCVAKPETYEERKKRRDAEIEGLKEALSILDEAAFVQREPRLGGLRGAAIAPH